jgi:hypothetical protein
MTTVINLLMVLAAAALIGYPFIAGNRRGGVAAEVDEAVVDKREVLFSALGEIEFDYRMKKLGAEDYAELKGEYQARAMEVIEKEDAMLDRELAKELGGRRGKDREDSDEQEN